MIFDKIINSNFWLKEKFLDEQRVVVLYETNIHVLVVPIKGLHPEKGKDSVSTDLWNNNILNIILSKCTMYTQ